MGKGSKKGDALPSLPPAHCTTEDDCAEECGSDVLVLVSVTTLLEVSVVPTSTHSGFEPGACGVVHQNTEAYGLEAPSMSKLARKTRRCKGKE